ncbi:MAG: hypothetical protein HY466_07385 [Deltaproteobacteria bacterium]|nr:hypothetical protein [Deltaproteobacteria bacterium]
MADLPTMFAGLTRRENSALDRGYTVMDRVILKAEKKGTPLTDEYLEKTLDKLAAKCWNPKSREPIRPRTVAVYNCGAAWALQHEITRREKK